MSATPDDTIWEADPHTLAKIELLRRYLNAWFPIVGNSFRELTYIDGFCGPGIYKGGEDGSPVAALKSASNATMKKANKVLFVFNDKRQDRIDCLDELIQNFNYSDIFTIATRVSSFDVKIKEILDYFEDRDSINPLFAFIDPFGYKGVDYNSISRLFGMKSTEVLIYFSVSGLNRNIDQDKSRKEIYRFFGERVDIPENIESRTEWLRDKYQKQLEKLADYVRYFEFSDKNNIPIYYLFFATNSDKGFVKMKEAMWSINKIDGYRFSDRTERRRQVFMFDEFDTYQLKQQLVDSFKGNKVNGDEVDSYVNLNTSFISRHKTMALRELEDEGLIEVKDEKIDGKKRRKGTFPSESVIYFK